MAKKEIQKWGPFEWERGCLYGSPFDNGTPYIMADFLAITSGYYEKKKNYSLDEIIEIASKNENNRAYGEAMLQYKKTSYCVKMYLPIIGNKKEINIYNRTVSGDESRATIESDKTIRLTFYANHTNIKKDETYTKSLEVANLIDQYYFQPHDKVNRIEEVVYKTYQGGVFIDEKMMNEDQLHALRFFVSTEEGSKFVAQFAKKGDKLFGKEYVRDGEFYNKYKIGLLIHCSNIDGYSEWDCVKVPNLVNGHKVFVVTAAPRPTRKYFLETNTRKKIYILEALLHEFFLHGIMDLNDFNLGYRSKDGNIIKKREKTDHYIATYNEFFLKYKYMKFLDVVEKTSLIWPCKSYKILKEYADKISTEYKQNDIMLQRLMFDFRGSQCGVDKNGIIDPNNFEIE